MMIEVKHLKKYYRYGIKGILLMALNDVSFNVEEGQICGLLGANGAGKSTTIKILLGLSRANKGYAKIFGKNIDTQGRKDIGYLPEAPYFYKYLSGFELVNFHAKLCGLSSKSAKIATMKALNIVGLDDASDKQIGIYSKGMVQRVGLAQAIVHNPKLLILDEPASGLDPIGISDMAEIILRLRAEGKTILLCSHLMSEVEKLCSKIVILSKGELVADGDIDLLLKKENTYDMTFSNADDQKISQLKDYALKLGLNIDTQRKSKMPLEEFLKKQIK